jgi:two-component system nitrate/nitrite response regulator NarL
MLIQEFEQLPIPRERSHWLVAYCGVGAVGKLCTSISGFRLYGHATSVNELLRKLSATPPDIILMDDAVLNHCGLTGLTQVHRALPRARTVLIGDSLQLSTIFAALRLGTWGVLARTRIAVDLERALKAVAGGELWLSRPQLAGLVAFANAESESDFAELTPRENAVARGILVGQSNKQIAGALKIAEHTVKIHVHHIYTKLRVHGRVELLLHYRRNCTPAAAL